MPDISSVNRLPNQWQSKTKITGIVNDFDASVNQAIEQIDTEFLTRIVDSASKNELVQMFSFISGTQVDFDNIEAVTKDSLQRWVKALAVSARSHGTIEDIIATWDAATADLGLDIEVHTSDPSGTVQITIDPLTPLALQILIIPLIGKSRALGMDIQFL